MKRQAITVSIKELIGIAKQLCNETCFDGGGIDVTKKFQMNIINKTPECSDTWEFE